MEIEFQNRRRLLRLILAAGAGSLLTRRAAIAQGLDQALNTIQRTPAVDPNTACAADPMETAGPFPSDGTNRIAGKVSDVLLDSRILRSDIRGSFGSSSVRAAGVPLEVPLQ